MNLRLNRLWPLFFITAFLFVPKFTLAAEWTNIGFASNNVKTVYADPKNNQKILVSLASIFEDSYNYITENGGSSWLPINMGGSISACNTFSVNPNTPNEIWAGCNPGIFRSIDGGKTFTSASTYFRYSQNIQLQISVDGTIFLINGSQELWRSSDGIIWERSFVPGAGSTSFYLNKHKQNEIYVSRAGSTGPGLYKSSDKGGTWAYIYSAVPIRNGVGQMTFTSGGKTCASAGTYGIGCSTDGGFSWTTFASPNPEKPSEYQHFYRLEQNPDDENNLLVLAGTWGGLDTKIYSYKSGVVLPEVLTIPDYTGAITISQGVVYSWSHNATWTKGIWRNDGIAVVPEYLKKHPVIIVPGFLGSWRKTSSSTEFEIDPILGKYNYLIKAFEQNGYQLGKELFIFPYNWRLDNAYSASLLKTKIDEAKIASGSDKVDIVAHSMGGIVARAYAQSTDYQNDISKIIFLGTPHLGSPEAYPVWEAGDVGFNKSFVVAKLLDIIFTEEASINGYFGANALFRYVRSSVSTVEQLLPISNYLTCYGSADYYMYPFLYPQNPFLDNLNANKGVIKQKGIKITNIVTDNLETVFGFGIVDYPESGLLWEDGIPYNYYSNRLGVNMGLGDGTVPLSSATALDGEIITKHNIEHSDLPNKTTADIFNALGINYSPLETINVINKYLLVAAYSPVDFYVLAPDGKKIGFNRDGGAFNEISGAFYTGNDTDAEFITIPNPLPGEYKVVATGTGTGSYEIEATYADDEANTTVSSSYTGQATLGKEDNLLVELAPDAGTIETTIDDKTAPVTTATTSGTKVGEFYNTDVQITLSAIDIESGVKKTEYSLDGIIWQDYASPVVLSQDGEIAISYRSTDQVENTEEAQNLVIKIDKTAPVVTIALDKTIFTHWDNLDIGCDISDNYSGISNFVLKLDGNVSDCERLVNLFDQALGAHKIEYTAVDKAGNTTTGEQTYMLVANYGSTLRDIAWLYGNKHFKSRGEAVSVAAHVELSWLFDVIGLMRKSTASLEQAQSLLDKQFAKNKITSYSYDMITSDIKFILEGK